MPGKIHPIPLYTTSGDLGGFLLYPHLYNSQGEWIGWVTAEREVFSVFGHYVGWLAKDFRVLRKRTLTNEQAQLTPPLPPPKFTPPARIPLPPMMAEISSSTIDVLEERPDLLPTQDSFAFTDDVG